MYLRSSSTLIECFTGNLISLRHTSCLTGTVVVYTVLVVDVF